MKIEKAILKICPPAQKLPIQYHYQKFRRRLEKELFLVERFFSRGKRAIDVGANLGIYSYVMSQYFEVVEAFEPQFWCTENLKAYSEGHQEKIRIHHVGLSNCNESLKLHIPFSDNDYSILVPSLGKVVSGLGSFRELEEESASVEVPVRKLDDYHFTDVSFIKIDVEGYESKVIEGGRETLLREKPIIFVEIEQKHLEDKNIEEVFEEIKSLGYEGNFFWRDKLKPLSEFSYAIHQQPFLDKPSGEDYIRNFIFKPIG